MREQELKETMKKVRESANGLINGFSNLNNNPGFLKMQAALQVLDAVDKIKIKARFPRKLKKQLQKRYIKELTARP